MRAWQKSGSKAEDGFTIIEVLIAAMILTLAALATFGVMASAVRNGQRAKQTQVALDRAQEEMEKLHSLTYKQLALTTTPGHAASTLNPNHRVDTSNGTFALQREPPSEPATMVVNGEVGLVTPGPISFKDGDVTGELYRYVVWRNDGKCPESKEGKNNFCPGLHDYKQIVVAAKLDTLGNQSAERGYVEVQSKAVDPSATANPTTGGGSSGSEGSEGGTGSIENSVTAQQFFLTDTPCATDGSTEREEIAGDHLLHNTLGTCASGPQAGSTLGAPDALLLGGPPDPAPEDPSDPALYDYSNDGYLEPTPDTDKGVQIKRDDTSGCHYTPTGSVNPESKAHRWVSDPLAASFKMNGKVTLEFYTRTLNDALYHGTLCVYLYARHETGSGGKTIATDSMLKNKTGGAAYWKYEPQGNGFWPRNAWTKVRLTMEFEGAPYTIPAGDRLGVALSVDPGNTDAEAIPIMYDHPNYPTRIEVDTTTPIDGGEGG